MNRLAEEDLLAAHDAKVFPLPPRLALVSIVPRLPYCPCVFVEHQDTTSPFDCASHCHKMFHCSLLLEIIRAVVLLD